MVLLLLVVFIFCPSHARHHYSQWALEMDFESPTSIHSFCHFVLTLARECGERTHHAMVSVWIREYVMSVSLTLKRCGNSF